MLIRYGFEIGLEFPQPTTLLTALDVAEDRRKDIVKEQPVEASPSLPAQTYVDMFGNIRRRIHAPAGLTTLCCRGVIRDSGAHDPVVADAPQVQIADLPTETLVYTTGSRYCETDLLSGVAWSKFGHLQGGWERVQAVCDFVHQHITFDYQQARATRTAAQAYEEKVGVCRDFTHLAVTLVRALNIPARYCNGYLGDIGVSADPAPMDFNAWFEAFVGGAWYVFDARHNQARIGRIVIARGRDATDIPMVHSFGPHWLGRFDVTTEQVMDEHALAAE